MKKYNALKTKLKISTIAWLASCLMLAVVGSVIRNCELQGTPWSTVIIVVDLIFGMVAYHHINVYKKLLQAEKSRMRADSKNQ